MKDRHEVKIKIAENDDELKKCYPVMQQLRPNIHPDEFLRKTRHQKQLFSYNIVYLTVDDEVASVAGFRITENLGYGKFLFIDEFITDKNKRSLKYGDKLFDWLTAFAKSLSCNEVQLDAGVMRHDAHRFYLRKRMKITSHHFILELN